MWRIESCFFLRTWKMYIHWIYTIYIYLHHIYIVYWYNLYVFVCDRTYLHQKAMCKNRTYMNKCFNKMCRQHLAKKALPNSNWRQTLHKACSMTVKRPKARLNLTGKAISYFPHNAIPVFASLHGHLNMPVSWSRHWLLEGTGRDRGHGHDHSSGHWEGFLHMDLSGLH